jgi:hypothetical protein
LGRPAFDEAASSAAARVAPALKTEAAAMGAGRSRVVKRRMAKGVQTGKKIIESLRGLVDSCHV